MRNAYKILPETTKAKGLYVHSVLAGKPE